MCATTTLPVSIPICAWVIDGLATVVTQQYGGWLCKGSLFLCRGHRTEWLKTLYLIICMHPLLYKTVKRKIKGSADLGRQI